MAILRGEQGSVKFGAGGTLAALAGTRSWSLNITKETLDTTKHGENSRTFVGSMVSGSGTVELVFTTEDTSQTGFIEDVLTADDAADAAFELFTTGNTADTNSLTFNGIITSADISSTAGDLVVVTCNFITSGDITSNL